MIRVALAMSALTLLACNGCNSGGSGPPPGPSGGMPPPGAEVVVHAEDDGRAFDVTRGSMVTFKLAGNAGTGYQWAPGPQGIDPNVLAQQGGPTSEMASPDPGAAKLDVFRFVANNPGTALVEMDLRRAFGNAPPGRVVHFTINVH
jgi:predicted secreted protein